MMRVLLLLFPFLLAQLAQGTALPEPPQQHAPWDPPARQAMQGVPMYVASTAAALFQAGLADPRGGEYREIEVPGPGKDKGVRTHGWVFEGKLAVCWDGLVYRLLSAGAPADVSRDVEAIATLVSKRSSEMAPAFYQHGPEIEFWVSLESGGAVPVAIMLLVRAGRPDLAAQLYLVAKREVVGPDEPTEEDAAWSPLVARLWLEGAFRRLCAARTRGDDADAVAVADSLLAWEQRARSSFAELSKVLSFLEPLRALRADSQRRLREPARPLFDAMANAQLPPAARIADLIVRLDEMLAGQPFSPGPLIFGLDPVYRRLAQEGEAAVEVLLDAYEYDGRLTRTFDYTRPWRIQCVPVSVKSAVKSLLTDILRAPDVVERSTPAQLRAWWHSQESANRGPAARSFAVLSDDSASPQSWLASADFITLRSDVDSSVAGMIATGKGDRCDPGKPAPPLHGESLRHRYNPSVNELLARRTQAMLATPDTGRPPAACKMAFLAFRWERASALPVLQQAGRAEACARDPKVAAARMLLGDTQAAVEWSNAIRRPDDQSFGDHAEDLLPLWLFPNDAALAAAAEWLFAAPEAPLAPAARPYMVPSPLLRMNSYRKAVLAALEDGSEAGEVTRQPDGSLSWSARNGASGAGGEARKNPSTAAPSALTRSFRTKDLIAWQLTSLDGAPEFELDWPVSEKDTAIRRLAGLVHEQGGNWQPYPASLEETACPGMNSLSLGKKQ